MLKKIKLKVALFFGTLPEAELSPFAAKVIAGLIKEAVTFNDPPVTPTVLQAKLTTYETALAKTIGGGPLETAEKDEAQADLIDALAKNALYVQIVSDNDLTTLLSSGYLAASTNRTQRVLEQVQIRSVSNGQTGELKVRVQPVQNAKSFEGRIKPVNGSEFGPSITFASSRKILFDALTAGVSYILQIRAIGGSTGSGDWSDPTSHMAM